MPVLYRVLGFEKGFMNELQAFTGCLEFEVVQRLWLKASFLGYCGLRVSVGHVEAGL